MLWLVAGVLAFYTQAVLLKRVLPVPLRYANSVALWLLTIATATMPFLLAVVPYFTVRFVSESLYVRIGCFIQKQYLQLWMFMILFFMEIRFKCYGDALDPRSTNLWIANHVTHDWLAIYPTMFFFGVTGFERCVIKDVIGKIPFLGWAMTMLYWPFLARSYESDVGLLRLLFGKYKTSQVPLQVWIFPEGTRPTRAKIAASQEHARKTNKPVWDNVMLPRHRGFCVCAESLQGVAGAVEDATIAYEGFKDARFVPLSEFMLYDHDRPHTVHVDIRRVPLAAIPMDEEGRKEWLMNSFQAKEEKLAHFYKHTSFGDVIGRDDAPAKHWMVAVRAYIFLAVTWTVTPWVFRGVWCSVLALF